MKAKMIVAALTALMSLGLQADTICGDRTTTPATNRVEVACIDFDALAQLGVPGVSGKRTQVLLHAKYGDSVRVELFYTDFEGKEASVLRWADLRRDASQNLVAIVQAPGVKYTRYTIEVKRNAE